MKETKRGKHASYSSHNSCKSLSEELRDYYEERHRSHLRPHSHRREKNGVDSSTRNLTTQPNNTMRPMTVAYSQNVFFKRFTL